MLVLIVDDDSHFRLFASRALAARGYDVEELDSAFGLVNRAAGFRAGGVPVPRPDVIVLDHMMPGLPGADSLKLLGRDPRTADIPVVLVSAATPTAMVRAAGTHPRCRFVQKSGHVGPVIAAVTDLSPDDGHAKGS